MTQYEDEIRLVEVSDYMDLNVKSEDGKTEVQMKGVKIDMTIEELEQKIREETEDFKSHYKQSDLYLSLFESEDLFISSNQLPLWHYGINRYSNLRFSYKSIGVKLPNGDTIFVRTNGKPEVSQEQLKEEIKKQRPELG